MRNKFYLVLLSVLALTLVSCDPENDDPITPTPSTSNVFIVGNNSNNSRFGPATLWKNGVKEILSNDLNSSAHAIFVDDNNNVYVGGKEYDKPVIWKNGVLQILSSSMGCVNGLVVKNDTVYAVGFIDRYAVIWRNGIVDTLSIEGIDPYNGVVATAIYINENDVYISGYVGYYSGSNPEGIALLWKNGQLSIISDQIAIAHDLAVLDNKVYIVGNQNFRHSDFSTSEAVLWTNGVVQNLNIGGVRSYANAIFIANGTPYIACYTFFDSSDNSYYKGVLWNNNSISMLECNSLLDLFVHGSDVYLLGWRGVDYIQPVLLKNGVEIPFSNVGCCPKAIYVK